MIKLYFGSSTAALATLLLIMNVGYPVWCSLRHTSIQTWGLPILLLILLNGVFWYIANVRDLYSNSIVHAIDGSKEMGLFSANSIQSIIYWCASIVIWSAGLIAIFKPENRQTIFFFIAAVGMLQLAFIEGSRILLFHSAPSRFYDR